MQNFPSKEMQAMRKTLTADSSIQDKQQAIERLNKNYDTINSFYIENPIPEKFSFLREEFTKLRLVLNPSTAPSWLSSAFSSADSTLLIDVDEAMKYINGTHIKTINSIIHDSEELSFPIKMEFGYICDEIKQALVTIEKTPTLKK